MALPRFSKDLAYISKLEDEPNDVGGLSADAFKTQFDLAPQDIQDYINEELIPRIESDIEAAALGVGAGGAIDGSTISNGSIGTAKLADGAVTTAKIADSGITTAKLASKVVTAAKLADNAVTGSAVADGAVTRNKLADEVISSDKIFPGAVGNAKIAANAVSTDKVADKAITRAKLANDALYSPVKFITTAEYTVDATDTGKTLVVNVSNNNATINLTQQTSLAMNGRDEIAVFWLSANSVTIVPDGVRFAVTGETALRSPPVKITDKYGACSLKRIAGDTTYGDIWFVTGNVEVVS